MGSFEDLRRRVAQLDQGLRDPPFQADGCDAYLTRFADVLGRVTSTGIEKGVDKVSPLSAAMADAQVQNCDLLLGLKRLVPNIVYGPLSSGTQYWISTGKPGHLPPREPVFDKRRFVAASSATRMQPCTKPFGIGLFTSTDIDGKCGMWHMYLDLFTSTLFPTPWYTWAVKPHDDISVREVTNALDWVEFVLSYPIRMRGFVYPDWRLVARDYDAIHMTLRAIVATQGYCFASDDGAVAAPYWDIESTFWLRWCFRSAELVSVVD